MLFGRRKTTLPAPEEALAGRPTPMTVLDRHAVLGTSLQGPFPAGLEVAIVGMGCFWGAERAFWTVPGVYSTSVGYAGGYTPNPTYEEVCSGRTGHCEVVRIVFDPAVLAYETLLTTFWESHNPTQGMRQGGDVGTQYRSIILTTTPAQARIAQAGRQAYQSVLTRGRYGPITTEIAPAGPYYLAEDYHQQYLHKVPHGYCGLAGTGLSCPVGLAAAE